MANAKTEKLNAVDARQGDGRSVTFRVLTITLPFIAIAGLFLLLGWSS